MFPKSVGKMLPPKHRGNRWTDRFPRAFDQTQTERTSRSETAALAEHFGESQKQVGGASLAGGHTQASACEPDRQQRRDAPPSASPLFFFFFPQRRKITSKRKPDARGGARPGGDPVSRERLGGPYRWGPSPSPSPPCAPPPETRALERDPGPRLLANNEHFLSFVFSLATAGPISQASATSAVYFGSPYVQREGGVGGGGSSLRKYSRGRRLFRLQGPLLS